MDILHNAEIWIVTTLIAPFIAMKFRSIWTHSSTAFQVNAKKGFSSLPSFWQKVIYSLWLDAKNLFPEDKQEQALDWVCMTLKTMIKGDIDDIVIDAIREELKKK